jgi:hypothetical protein
VNELREIQRRYSKDEGLRAIARGTGADRKTVAKMAAGSAAVGLYRGAPARTDEQFAELVARPRAAPVGRQPELGERLARTSRRSGLAGRGSAADQLAQASVESWGASSPIARSIASPRPTAGSARRRR